MIPFPNIDPIIFSFDFMGIEFALRWYALSYILGFVCAILVMKLLINQTQLWPSNGSAMNVNQADALLTYLILGVIVGGRLGYVVFYNLDYYISNPFDVFRIWDGGMAFHGGFIGVVIAVCLYSRFNMLSIWSVADLVAVASPPGLFLGRIANFINAELWGRPTDVPWGVIFPGDRAQDCGGIAGFCARHPSQIYEALMEGLLLFLILILMSIFGALKRPGLITGVFAAGYGTSRFIVEYFRVPDPQFFSILNPYGFAFKLGDFGITMGQALSLPMIGTGVILIVWTTTFYRSN